jgi:nitrogen-specific signal transduction histidine kinase
VSDASGAIVRIVGLAQDITARREIEEQLREAQKMESLGRLAGGVAHDFNNILTVVDTCTELLGDALPATAEGHDLVAELQRASARAGALTQQLLVFGRREIVAPKAVELDVLVGDTAKMLRRLIGEDIAVRVDLRARAARVWIDPGSLAQVLVNLAVNARDAMPHGGTLTLRTEIETDADRTSLPSRGRPFVRLAVSDTGAGMSREVRQRVFEPFFTTKPTGQGTGLGLSVVHGIVERSGGFIDVASTVGEGTTFEIHLPLLTTGAAAAAVNDGATTGRGERVLFVEDDDSVRRIACTALRNRGYEVIGAESGAQALEALAGATAFDLVVTDVVMPGMDGREFVQRAREGHPTLRVLYTSGYTDDDVLVRGVSRAEVQFLPKPYSIATLVAKVREVLDAS